MAHLVDADHDLFDEDDIASLFDHLRGGPPRSPRGPGRPGDLSEVPRRDPDQCVECGRRVELYVEEADYVCTGCGLVQPHVHYYAECWEDHERADTRGGAAREGYKPIHHWHERIAQYHLQETAIVARDWVRILDGLLAARPPELTKESLRRVLRSVRLQRYNENWLQIIHRLTGYRPPPLRPEEVRVLDACFEGLQEPFRIFKPPGRKNLLNYNFILARLLQRIGRSDCLAHFPQLKTQSKWRELDAVWARICDWHRWPHEAPPGDLETLAIETTPGVWRRAEEQREVARLAPAPAPRVRRVHGFEDRRLLAKLRRRHRLADHRRLDQVELAEAPQRATERRAARWAKKSRSAAL